MKRLQYSLKRFLSTLVVTIAVGLVVLGSAYRFLLPLPDVCRVMAVTILSGISGFISSTVVLIVMPPLRNKNISKKRE